MIIHVFLMHWGNGLQRYYFFLKCTNFSERKMHKIFYFLAITLYIRETARSSQTAPLPHFHTRMWVLSHRGTITFHVFIPKNLKSS